jgi:hypothetical protein
VVQSVALAVVLVTAGALGLLAAAGPSHAAASQTLDAGFDADGNIYLTFADGTQIGTPTAPGTVIPAGTYTIVLNNNGLDDQARPHQYHLFGPGVNLSAGQAIGATWSATFLAGSTYVYQDDLNPTTLHDVFGTPGSGATSTTVPSTTAPPAATGQASSKPTDNSPLAPNAVKAATFRGTLVGAVSATGKLTLVDQGKAVSSLKAGRYKISVTDRSARGGFTIQEIRKAAITVSGVSFTGKHSITLNLAAGQWFFYTTFVARKNYFIVVA